jgi:hypothetical protein
MPDSGDGRRPISQTPYPIRFAAKSTILAAGKPRPDDAEMQHDRQADVDRRQQQNGWHALTLWEGRGVYHCEDHALRRLRACHPQRAEHD